MENERKRFLHAYKSLLEEQKTPLSNAQYFMRRVEKDFVVLWGVNMRAHAERKPRKTILESLGPFMDESSVLSVFAAEIFPDRNPPAIVISDNEADIHDELRAKYPSNEPRISAEVIHAIADTQFIRLDPISLRSNLVDVPTKAPLEKIVRLISENGYIPVDANFEIISPKI